LQRLVVTAEDVMDTIDHCSSLSRRLIHIHINGKRLTDKTFARVLTHLTSLQHLGIEFEQRSNLNWSFVFEKMGSTSLKSIYIRNLAEVPFFARAVTGITSLTSLRLEWEQDPLLGTALSPLVELRLVELELMGSRIRESGLMPLLDITTLRYLNITKCFGIPPGMLTKIASLPLRGFGLSIGGLFTPETFSVYLRNIGIGLQKLVLADVEEKQSQPVIACLGNMVYTDNLKDLTLIDCTFTEDQLRSIIVMCTGLQRITLKESDAMIVKENNNGKFISQRKKPRDILPQFLSYENTLLLRQRR